MRVSVLLRLGFFLMMGAGLLLASYFLWIDKLDGGNWVAVCSVLFGADRLSNALTDGISSRQTGEQVQ